MQLSIGLLSAAAPRTVPTDVDADSLNARRLMLPGSTSGRRAYGGPQGDSQYAVRMPAHLSRVAISSRARRLPTNWSGQYAGQNVSINGELLRLWLPAYAGCLLSVRIAVQFFPPPAVDSAGVGRTTVDMVLAWCPYEPGRGGARDATKEILVQPTAMWQTNPSNPGYDSQIRKSWTRSVVIVPDADGPLRLRLYGPVTAAGAPIHHAMMFVS
ncbi:hypothetical protein [Thauera sinica]|uniref:Uncharacterized protein n=1 Tax=Thauera sinica TaxID=2665146 RepID=A0ABW1ARM7_9RHOO|nr:hypothetical protein [Thauera sp. K11]ATE60177.1 hypothetical protein CCZ27_09640 [Thauera sp. K11]